MTTTAMTATKTEGSWPIWLVSGATRTVYRHHNLGVLYVPQAGNRRGPEGRPWAIDNGAFTWFDAEAFMALLYRWRHEAGCLFAVAPDVVGDAAATRQLWETWAPLVRALGYPVGYVAQDGTPDTPVPVDADAVFIGGSTAFKESRAVLGICGYARARGQWVHMGRVNTRKRYEWANTCGVQSVDGTGFSMFADTYVGRVQRWTRQRRLSLA